MRLRPVRQHILPVWLLKGFTRGSGEEDETTWCYTADGVSATTLGLAGSVIDHAADPIPRAMIRDLDRRNHLFEPISRILRTVEPGEFVDDPPAAASLLGELGTRTYVVRRVLGREWISRLLLLVAFDEILDSEPEWAVAMAKDVERLGPEAVVEAACRRSPGTTRNRGTRSPIYRGSTKSLIKFWRAVTEAADRSDFRMALPDVRALVARWNERFKEANYAVVERSSETFILADTGMLARYLDDDEIQPFDLEEPDDLAAVLLPISSRRILVAAFDSSFDVTQLTTDEINRASAAWAGAFFVASRRKPGFEELRAALALDPWDDDPDSAASRRP